MITDSSAHEEKEEEEEEEDRTPARFWRSQKNWRKHLSASLQRQSRSREHWIFLLKQRIARNYRLPSPSPPRCAALPPLHTYSRPEWGRVFEIGTETPTGINPGIKIHSRGYQKIKHPVLIHNHRFNQNPPLFYITLVLKKSNTEFWYITMVLKKSSTKVLIYNHGSQEIKYQGFDI